MDGASESEGASDGREEDGMAQEPDAAIAGCQLGTVELASNSCKHRDGCPAVLKGRGFRIVAYQADYQARMPR